MLRSHSNIWSFGVAKVVGGNCDSYIQGSRFDGDLALFQFYDNRTLTADEVGSLFLSFGNATCTAGEPSGYLLTKTCSPCAAGTYSWTNGSPVCTACPASHVQPLVGQAGAAACTPCPAGQWTADGIVCSQCAKGTVSAGAGMHTLQSG